MGSWWGIADTLWPWCCNCGRCTVFDLRSQAGYLYEGKVASWVEAGGHSADTRSRPVRGQPIVTPKTPSASPPAPIGANPDAVGHHAAGGVIREGSERVLGILLVPGWADAPTP